MFTPKANSKQKWVKNSEIWMIWFSRNRVTFLENLSRFYVQNHYAFCRQKRGALAKTWHVFTVSDSDSTSQKSAISAWFYPKNPNFDPSITQNDLLQCLWVHYTTKHQKQFITTSSTTQFNTFDQIIMFLNLVPKLPFSIQFSWNHAYIYITIEMLTHPYLNSANSTAKWSGSLFLALPSWFFSFLPKLLFFLWYVQLCFFPYWLFYFLTNKV